MCVRSLLFLPSLILFAGCTSVPQNTNQEWPRYTLRATQVIVLNPPQGERYDASGLLLMPGGSLLTINNLRPQLNRTDVQPGVSEAPLQPVEGCFSAASLSPLRADRFDLEGLARDDQERLYVCDEANRWILRCDPQTGRVERLPIDWSPVEDFFSAERNASFEGVAVGEGQLYVANERSAPLIITMDLRTLRVTDWFQPQPRKFSLLGTHYSDLCWFEGKLWVLCRQHRVVLAVNPATREVLAEFDYEAVEDALGYQKTLPVGIMEGLAVDRDSIWLVTDNNGWPRKSSANDLRPTLVKCPRPDRSR